MKFSLPLRHLLACAALFVLSAMPHSFAETLRSHPQNPWLLEYRGKPTVLRTFGEHYSSVINTSFDYLPYLDVLRRDKMNLTRAFLVAFRENTAGPTLDPLAPSPAHYLQPWLRTDTQGSALDGLGKWDFSTWNEEYFTRLTSFAQACSDRGIVVEFTLFCTYYNDLQWQASPFNPANNVQGHGPANRHDCFRPGNPQLLAAQEAVVRRIVRELNRFDNIYYSVQNEPFWNQPGIKDNEEVQFHDAILGYIRDEESALPKRHLVAHNFPQKIGSFSGQYDIINEHYPAAVPGTTIAGAEALLRDHYPLGKILSLDETDTPTPTQARLEAWMFIHGGGGIYNGLDYVNLIYTAENEPGDSPLGKSLRGTVRGMGIHVDNLHLTGLRRDLTWITSTLPAGSTLQAMANPGQQYAAYLHHGKSGQYNFQLHYDPIDGAEQTATLAVDLPAGDWRAVWTRPADLTVLQVEPFSHPGGTFTLAPVSYSEDVALRIDRSGAGDLTPPPSPADFTAASGADGAISLTWSPVNAADLAGYHIHRSETSGITPDSGNHLVELPATASTFLDSSAVPGTIYHYRILAADDQGNLSLPSDETPVASIRDNEPSGGVPHSIPGMIQAEDFDLGGQDVAYHDATSENEGSQYRTSEAVDLESTGDAGGGHHVSATLGGEWLEYTVNVEHAGGYSLDFRISNELSGGELFFEIDGALLAGGLQVPETGAGVWQTVRIPEVELAAGRHILRLGIAAHAEGGTAGLINWIAFSRIVSTGPTAHPGGDVDVTDADFDGVASISLDASASLAGDSPITTYTWTSGTTPLASGVAPVVTLPLGIHPVTLTVIDQNGLQHSAGITVRVSPSGFINGSFESGYEGWTVTGHQTVKSGSPYVPTDGTNLVAFNNNEVTPNGVLFQTFATTPGQLYVLAFDMGVLAYNNSQQRLQVQVTGTTALVNQTHITNRLNNQLIRWEAKSHPFTADSTSTTLTFRDLSTATNALDLTLDNVRILPQITRTLTVESTAGGTAIAVTPADSRGLAGGPTALTRTYANATTVTLTAPAASGGLGFQKWTKNGTDLATTAAVSVLMDADHALTAVYVEGPPVITAHPQNASAASGATATFSVTAASTSPLFYQWRFNGTPIDGATGDTLSIVNVQTANTGSYDVVVTNSAGPVTSTPAHLSLLATGALVNGSFESGYDGWTFTGNQAIQTASFYTATDGTQLVAFNRGETPPNGVLSQTFATTPGQLYVLAFDMGVLAYNNSQQKLQIQVTGTGTLVHQTHTTNRVNNQLIRWESKSHPFTADSATTTLTFRDLSTATNALDLTLDNVRIIPQITRTLTVGADPASPVAITLAPADTLGRSGGTTALTRTYQNATTVTLTAPATSAGMAFQKWRKNGSDFATSPAVSLLMDGDHTLTAVYVPAITRTLTVESAPVSGIGISVNPVDTGGQGNGSSAFTRLYQDSANVTLTAPATISGHAFQKWRKNGSDLATTPAVSVLMDADHTLTAVYLPVIARTLTVASSTGVTSVTLTPADNNGLTGGTTSLTRLYPDTATVTITAPAASAGMVFQKWRKNDEDLSTNAAVSVLMDADHALTAVYVEGPPVITAHPQNASAASGASATFSVIATSPSPLSYQWRFNGTAIDGANSSTLAIPDVQAANTGSYDVIVTSSGGPVTSNPATLSLPATGTLANGSFENGYSGWTVTGNQALQTASLYTATDGTRLVSFNNNEATPNGILSQSFATTPGQSYVLTFDMGVLAYNNSQQRLQVQVTGSSTLVNQTHVTNRLNNQIIRWETKSHPFTADSASTTLTFRDLSTATNALDLTLDNVRVIPQVTRTLTVTSGPAAGTVIGLSPPDNNSQGGGVTAFTRTYPNGTTVNLTAPASTGGRTFQKWQKNGVDLATGSSISVLLDADLTLAALYVEGGSSIPSALKILPLGDSITFGYDGNNAGYRGPLYNLLNPAVPGLQYVGTTQMNSGALPVSPVDQRYHQGLSAYNILDITNNLDGLDTTRFTLLGGADKNPNGGFWLTGGNGTGRQPIVPDIITMMIGTNDLGSQTGVENRLRNLVTKITTLRPDTRLFLAKVTPAANYAAATASYNNIVTAMVAEFRAAGRNVHLVDMHTGFPANGMSTDGLHPNSTGFMFMAQRWNDAILASYPPVDPTGPPLVTDPPDSGSVATGGSVTLKVTAQGAGTLFYEWRFNGTAIPSATAPTLVLANVQSSAAGTYDVVVSNSHGQVTSHPATLTVLAAAVLVNGSFEADLNNWTASGNVQARPGTNPYSATDGGKIAAFNTSNSTPNGGLSQQVATTPGTLYTLSFDLGLLAYNTTPQQIQVTVNGTTSLLSRNISVTGPGNGTTRWQPQSFTFTADSESATLAFRDISSSTNAIDLLLDNVRLTAGSAPAAMAAATPLSPVQATATATAPAPPVRPLLGSPATENIGSASLTGTPGNHIITLNAVLSGSYFLERSSDLQHWERVGDDIVISSPALIEFPAPPDTTEARSGGQPLFYRIGRRPDSPHD